MTALFPVPVDPYEQARSDRCVEMGHPGVTYNPWDSRTWCLCGLRTYEGRSASVDDHLACCGGPLDIRPSR